MNDRKLIFDVAKGMVLLLVAMLACKYTKGGGAALLAIAAFVCAVSGRVGWALIAYILFPFMVVMNPYVLPKSGATGMILRVATLTTTVGLLISSVSRNGRHSIPIGAIWLYLGVAALSSMNGYYPEVSYLKLVNCAILFVGLQIGFRNMEWRPDDVMTVRKFLLVLVAFLIFGSVALAVLMPGAAYITSVKLVLEEEGLEAANAAIRSNTGVPLFAGLTNQSQCLATLLPCSMAWLVCDMFFVEKRISLFHMLTLTMGLPMIYMTRSRSAFLTSSVAVFIIYFYCLGKINIRMSVKRKIRSAMILAGIGIIILMAFLEVRNHSISKWLRKTEDVAGDARDFTEAFTASRQGAVESNLADFKVNPVFGTGFQVTYGMKYAFKGSKGMILSAPIEKSILPLMVLGETGVVGFAAFLIFLGTFYWTCVRKRYYCTLTLMTVFLTTNMAEATFFSPGGAGGALWVICVGGGFIIDTIVLYHRRLERIAREQQMMEMAMVMQGQ